MAWLAGQVYLLCLVSFLAGAAITAVALWRKPAARQLPAPEKDAEQPESAAETEVREEGVGEVTDVLPAITDDPEVVKATEPVIIKASRKSMRYHTPDSPYYERVSANLTFISTQEAELAGYKAWNADKAPVGSS